MCKKSRITYISIDLKLCGSVYQLFNYLLSNYLDVTETSFMFHLEIYLCADNEVPLIVNTSLKHKLVFSLNCLTVEERL